MISQTAWKVIHYSQRLFSGTHFYSIFSNAYECIACSNEHLHYQVSNNQGQQKAVSFLKLHFIFTAPYQVTTNLLQVVSWSVRLKKYVLETSSVFSEMCFSSSVLHFTTSTIFILLWSKVYRQSFYSINLLEYLDHVQTTFWWKKYQKLEKLNSKFCAGG